MKTASVFPSLTKDWTEESRQAEQATEQNETERGKKFNDNLIEM